MKSILSLFFLVLFLPLFVVFFFLLWALGLPIAVKSKGTKVGYLRWFKYTKV